MRRQVVAVVMGLCLVALAWLVTKRVLEAVPPFITEEMAAKIQVGMTEREIEGLLGGPAGDYTNGTCASRLVLRYVVSVDYKRWTGEEVEIVIGVDRGRRTVVEKHLARTERIQPWFTNTPGLLARFRLWLGW